MDYSKFRAIDFIKDESFQEWCLDPEGKHALFWEKWLDDHPDKLEELQKARQILASFQGLESDLSESRIEQIWDAIGHHTQKSIPIPIGRRALFRRWGRVAAACTGILAVAFYGLYRLENKEITRTLVTAHGEVKSVLLPDSSSVVMNANSVLHYNEKDFKEGRRIVNLTGEAHFDVFHTPDHSRFTVQTNDEIKVEVLGTKFTMTSRSMKKQVVLEEGSVKVNPPAQSGNAVRNAVIMTPGDLIAWDSQVGDWQKERVADPDRYSSFIQNRLVFRKTPLHEIARVLEDDFGYHVIFDDPQVMQKHFTGACNADDIQLLLKSIEKAFNLSVEMSGTQIAVRNTK